MPTRSFTRREDTMDIKYSQGHLYIIFAVSNFSYFTEHGDYLFLEEYIKLKEMEFLEPFTFLAGVTEEENAGKTENWKHIG